MKKKSLKLPNINQCIKCRRKLEKGFSVYCKRCEKKELTPNVREQYRKVFEFI